jgi:hypothetical protein
MMRFGFVGLVLLIAGCSFLPFPVQLDLGQDFKDTKGQFEVVLPTGKIEVAEGMNAIQGSLGPFSSPLAGLQIDLTENITLPDTEGYLVDFSEQKLKEELLSAQLAYALELNLEGPVSADLTLQAYLGPISETPLISDAYKLGETKRVELSKTTTLSEIINLNFEQIQAINEGQLRFAVVLSKASLKFLEPGSSSLSYKLKSLSLSADKAIIPVLEVLPEADGSLIDFSDQELPAVGRLATLGLEYELKLKGSVDMDGTLEAQLYLAPDTAEDLFQERYTFGVKQILDLSQGEVTLLDRAALNEEQMSILESKKVRIGLIIQGSPAITLGENLKVDYEFSKLMLFGGFSIN